MKTYTQDEVDELVAAEEQRGYDSGRKTGIQEGIKMASLFLMTEAGAAFTRGEDEKANQIRLLAQIVGQMTP